MFGVNLAFPHHCPQEAQGLNPAGARIVLLCQQDVLAVEIEMSGWKICNFVQASEYTKALLTQRSKGELAMKLRWLVGLFALAVGIFIGACSEEVVTPSSEDTGNTLFSRPIVAMEDSTGGGGAPGDSGNPNPRHKDDDPPPATEITWGELKGLFR
jgi:hypothetical protein